MKWPTHIFLIRFQTIFSQSARKNSLTGRRFVLVVKAELIKKGLDYARFGLVTLGQVYVSNYDRNQHRGNYFNAPSEVDAKINPKRQGWGSSRFTNM